MKTDVYLKIGSVFDIDLEMLAAKQERSVLPAKKETKERIDGNNE
jgi:hypothetical protein